MNTHTQKSDGLTGAASTIIIGLTLVAAAIILGALPALFPSMGQSLTGTIPHAYWYLSRTSGFAAYALLWFSMVFGLLLSNKLAKSTTGMPFSFDLHQFTSLASLAFTLFHMFILLGDKYIGYTFSQLFVPFAQADFQPFWSGVGQLGFYAMVLVTITFYLRSKISYRLFHIIHVVSYAMFLMALAHGLFAGTDTNTWWAMALYLGTAAITLFLTVYRVLSFWVEDKSRRSVKA